MLNSESYYKVLPKIQLWTLEFLLSAHLFNAFTSKANPHHQQRGSPGVTFSLASVVAHCIIHPMMGAASDSLPPHLSAVPLSVTPFPTYPLHPWFWRAPGTAPFPSQWHSRSEMKTHAGLNLPEVDVWNEGKKRPKHVLSSSTSLS